MGLLSGEFAKEWGCVRGSDELCHWSRGVDRSDGCKTWCCQILQLCDSSFSNGLVMLDRCDVVVGVVGQCRYYCMSQ